MQKTYSSLKLCCSMNIYLHSTFDDLFAHCNVNTQCAQRVSPCHRFTACVIVYLILFTDYNYYDYWDCNCSAHANTNANANYELTFVLTSTVTTRRLSAMRIIMKQLILFSQSQNHGDLGLNANWNLAFAIVGIWVFRLKRKIFIFILVVNYSLTWPKPDRARQRRDLVTITRGYIIAFCPCFVGSKYHMKTGSSARTECMNPLLGLIQALSTRMPSP